MRINLGLGIGVVEKELTVAAHQGDLETVRALLPVSDPKANESAALSGAAYNGHLDVVRVLLPISEPKTDDSAALSLAAHNGHLDVVRVLIPVSDPKAYGSAALYVAAYNGHLDVVRALIPVSNPSDAFQALLKKVLRDQAAPACENPKASKALMALNCMAPFVDPNEVGQALTSLSPEWRACAPYFTALDQESVLRSALEALPPANGAPVRRRPLL